MRLRTRGNVQRFGSHQIPAQRILKQGVKAWNRWRENNDILPDLSYVDLSEADLIGADSALRIKTYLGLALDFAFNRAINSLAFLIASRSLSFGNSNQGCVTRIVSLPLSAGSLYAPGSYKE